MPYEDCPDETHRNWLLPQLMPYHHNHLLPLGQGTPGPVLVGQDVEDLLLELIGCDVVTVLGGTNQVVTHLLFILPVSSILGTV